jgi:hypothetical protein
MFDFSRPELRVWANSDSEMQRFEILPFTVRSLWTMSGLQEYARRSRELAILYFLGSESASLRRVR